MAKSETDLQKVQFYFTQEALADLDEMQKELNASTRADALRHALRWMQWTLEQMKEGNKFYLKTADGIGPIAMPFGIKKRSLENSPTNRVSENGSL